MANIKQQKKRIRQDAFRTDRNRAVRSRMRTYIKNADVALAADDTTGAQDIVKKACSEIDRAAGKGVIHTNAAARKKSSLERRVAALKK